MRKLKLQVQMSIDGYIAGPNGEMDWMEWDWDDKLKQYVGDITASVDCIILGRKLAEGFIPYWSAVAANPEDPEHSAGAYGGRQGAGGRLYRSDRWQTPSGY